METARPGILAPHLPDDIAVRRWFAFYAVFLAGLAVPLGALLALELWGWSDWLKEPVQALSSTGLSVKLLVFALYLSVCCTLLPLPTGWIVAALATRQAAVANGASGSVVVIAFLTTLVVGLVGAAGSTVANLNDYHLFTWMLRHHRIAAVRQTRTYQSAARWFNRSPFFLLTVFNIMPVPVDIVRMLATTCRYPRVPFAAASFLGRFVRYGLIAMVTYWWDLGGIAPVALLILAAALGAGRLGPKLVRKLLRPLMNRRKDDLPDIQAMGKEQHT
jgi:membrane protein YqaA with SNARE-associated domain